MKSIIKNRVLAAAAVSLGLMAAGCNDYLDVTPPSDVVPEQYFTQADMLGYYTINLYTSGAGFPVHQDWSSYIDDDAQTDNENGESDIFCEESNYKVNQSGGDWWFDFINSVNWFICDVEPKIEAGKVQGDPNVINHYLGEAYFLRAREYFHRLRKLGDFPIITKDLPDVREILIENSKRQPRNMVARFILSDLDHAAELLTDGASTGGRSRITRDVALLMKARVALYEATWEKYFAGTPYVPDAKAGWEGAKKDYNKDFTYDNAKEVDFFLTEAMKAAKECADHHPNLTSNNKKEIGTAKTETGDIGSNPYYDMFAATDLSGYDEVLLYYHCNRDKGINHSINMYMRAGSSKGYTQEYANCFLMDNGLPIYASASGYAGDDYINDTKKNRDWRWKLFMKGAGDYAYSDVEDIMGYSNDKKKTPVVPEMRPSSKYSTGTGYKKGKCMVKNTKFTTQGTDETATVIFRASEAYLIYLEAAWEKLGDNLDETAWKYWKAIRKRAGVSEDIDKTIAATDLDKEEYYTHDLGLYSAGKRIESKVLYNIRRERRCEFISEGRRLDDLYRWRSLDQLKGGKFFLHGAKIYGPMLTELCDKKGKPMIKYDQAKESDNQYSSPSDVAGGFNGDPAYISLYRVTTANKFYESGMTWRMAHYLSPIAVDHFLVSSKDGSDIESSPIYQNPNWETVTGTYAKQ